MAFRDDQVMMCLASLSYRGFIEGSQGRFHTDLGRRAIVGGFETLPPLQDGKWELVWGPASYRAPLSLLDDEFMYVVRSGDGRNRYVVVIRGTNPISAFDWVFGDFWTGCLTPWPYDETSQAKISLSTALGLDILQALRAPGRVEDPRTGMRADALRLLDGVTGLLGNVVNHVTSNVMPHVDQAKGRVVELLQRIAQARAEVANDTPSHLRALVTFLKSQPRQAFVELVGEVARHSDSRLDQAVLGLLETEARWGARLGEGIDVRTFLRAAVEAAQNPIEVVVTGHSKGGGLASTVALWLEETHGKNAPLDEQWDPDGQATVSCYSFAGPTAGNEAFARRSNQRLKDRCYRIANQLDLVPHAWAKGDLAKIPALYQASGDVRDTLELLVAAVGEITNRMGYTQVEHVIPGLEPNLRGTLRGKSLFFDQFVYQHMDAYLDALDLTPLGITRDTFFGLTAATPR